METSILLLTANEDCHRDVPVILSDYAVFTGTNAAEASALCRQHDIDLVIFEKDLPEGSGISIFTKLRSDFPGLAGLLLAPSCDNAQLCQAIDAGLSGILDFPLDPENLRSRVQQALQATRLQEENTRLRTLLPLFSLGEQFLSSSSEEEILEGLLNVVEKQTAATNISVMLFDEEEECLRIAAARGLDRHLVESIRIRPGDQIAGWVFEHGKPVILNRKTQEQSIFASLLKRPEINAAISYPFAVRGRILGVLNISQTDSEAFFSEADNEMLAIVCSQAALALENVRALKILEEKVRMRSLFEQYVSPEVAELLISSDANLMNLGEVKDVTVLFADIRNFTGLVQHLELPDLRSFLNEFFQLFTETIFESRGTVDKFMGDAVLAVFGAPIALENANIAAVRAALKIRKRFADLRVRWLDFGDDFRTLDLGIAITNGPLFLGNVGSAQRLDYTVIGNQVNIAQRLAAESSSCQIYITEPVRAAIEGEIDVVEVGERSLRGVEQKVRVYSIMEEEGNNRSGC